MTIKQWGVAAVVAVLVLVLGLHDGLLYRKNVAFEARVVAAEARAKIAQAQVDTFKAIAQQALASAATKDTIVAHDTVEIAAVDAAHPADTSCAPNLAVRDKTIRDQKSEIVDLKTGAAAQMAALATLQASKDDLQHTLDTRPKLYPRFVGPNVGLGVFVGYCGTSPCVGAGITVNLASLRL